MSHDNKRSISLYSYQDEYYDGKLDLEGCLRETAKTGATGVELLAEQMIKKFPNPIEDEAFRANWFAMLDKYNLVPSCYDAFLENRIFSNRTLSLGEQVNMMKRDIRLAHLLGFPVLRTLVSTPMDVIEGSLDYAEEMNVKIGLEVHAPFSLNSGWADGYMEMINRTGTKFSGLMVTSQASPMAQQLAGMSVGLAVTAVSVLALFNAAGRGASPSSECPGGKL